MKSLYTKEIINLTYLLNKTKILIYYSNMKLNFVFFFFSFYFRNVRGKKGQENSNILKAIIIT